MSNIFDLDDLNAQLRQFAERAPQILRRVKLTEELAARLEQSLATTEAPFTLAVCGQMRVGKSTLINALVQADLAIPGVTETTATVNWFRHGTPEQTRKFRVVWNDLIGTSDEFELHEKDRWLGNSELASQTRFLEFFSTSPFLERVHVVDTPGTRSTLASHEEAARGFLLSEGRAERDSQFYGGVADCIIYALAPVTHQNDSDLLGQFASERRLPQSTPYNSVGVLHKWELLEHPTRWEEGAKQARRAFQALQSYVCDVIPVSGPLARACQLLPLKFWDDILKLVTGSTSNAMEKLTMQESWFTREEPGCPISPTERDSLLKESQLVWPCFMTILLLAASREFTNGADLQQTVREISGIDRLNAFLERRFFDRSRLIRAATVLNRALRLTDAARGRLRNRLADLATDQEMGQHALIEIEHATDLPQARTFINRRMADALQESNLLAGVLSDLETQAAAVRDSFEHFEQDCRRVQFLDDHFDHFDRTETTEILALLGAYGTGLSDRLGSIPGIRDFQKADSSPSKDDLITWLYDRLDFWLHRRHETTGELRIVLDQVVVRLEAIIRQLMRKSSDKDTIAIVIDR